MRYAGRVLTLFLTAAPAGAQPAVPPAYPRPRK